MNDFGEPIKEADLAAALLSNDPQVRLHIVGELLWQAQAFVRAVVLAQRQLTHLLPGEHLSEEAKKSIASVMRVTENTVGWLDDHCKSVYGQINKNKTPVATEVKQHLH
jgi:hypothetical protein